MSETLDAIIKKIEQDVRNQMDFEQSHICDVARKQYLENELKKAIAASGCSVSAKEYNKLLFDLDPRLFSK